jgi:hypothetical protein
MQTLLSTLNFIVIKKRKKLTHSALEEGADPELLLRGRVAWTRVKRAVGHDDVVLDVEGRQPSHHPLRAEDGVLATFETFD